MEGHRVVVSLWLICLLWLGPHASLAQTTASPGDTTAQAQEGWLTPETLAARKTAILDQIEQLGQLQLEPEPLNKARAPYEALLQILNALEKAWQQHAAHRKNLDELPQRLQALEAERQQLAAHQPPPFPHVTQELRDTYATQLQATRKEISDLNAAVSEGEVRRTTLADQLQQKQQERLSLEQQLRLARKQRPTPQEPPPPVSQVERLTLALQLLDADMKALVAEREWLTKRAPLLQARLEVAQLRVQAAQQAFDTIQQTLQTVLQQEQETLSSQKERLERQRDDTTDPVERLRLTLRLETFDIRQKTADYQHQITELSDTARHQEKRLVLAQQAVKRLRSLVEKYASHDVLAQRLQRAFARVQQERERARDVPIATMQKELRQLTLYMFDVDDRLLDFDQQIDRQLGGLRPMLAAVSPQQREADTARVRQLLSEQRAALLEQKQALETLVQDQTQLILAYRAYRKLLEEASRFVLHEMFWLRNRDELDLTVFNDIAVAVATTAKRLQDFVGTEFRRVRTKLADTTSLWLLLLLLGLVVPLGTWRLAAYLKRQITPPATANGEAPNGAIVFLLVLLRTALWPAYLVLVAGFYHQFLLTYPSLSELAPVKGLQMTAGVLWAALLTYEILRPDGPGRRYWAFSPTYCRFVSSVVLTGCVAVQVFIVPRHILLLAPGVGDTATSSGLLAIILLLLFQVVLLLLIAVSGWRDSPLMAVVLARSRQHQSLLWHIWPFAYLALMLGLVGILVLEILGYRYAAESIWLRVLETLSSVLLLRLLLFLLALHALHRLTLSVLTVGIRVRPREIALEEAVARYSRFAYNLCSIALVVIGTGVILEIWGISLVHFFTTPYGVDMLKRALFILLAMGIAMIVFQIGRVCTQYLMRPQTGEQGEMLEASGKRRTLLPLVQTVIKIGILFVTALVILDLLSIDIGPFLAGLGIFGLAIGFAAQSLIKDVINGLFILFEDNLSVGDIVTAHGLSGEVEKFTLRAVTIRDLHGNVHLIPNSAIDVITNMTKGFSRYVVDARVSLQEDVDTVINVMHEIDEEMRQDPEFGQHILQPAEVWGLERFEESALIIRTRLTTRPMQQWAIGREFNRRIKIAFDERGIRIPFPHRTLSWDAPSDGLQSSLSMSLEKQQPAGLED